MGCTVLLLMIEVMRICNVGVRAKTVGFWGCRVCQIEGLGFTFFRVWELAFGVGVVGIVVLIGICCVSIAFEAWDLGDLGWKDNGAFGL